MKTPNPECELDCRFREYNRGTTCAYYPPIYDKNGVNINPDRNLTTGEIHCTICNRKWSFSTVLGETTTKEILECTSQF